MRGEIQRAKGSHARASERKPAARETFDDFHCRCAVIHTVSTLGTISTFNWPGAPTRFSPVKSEHTYSAGLDVFRFEAV